MKILTKKPAVKEMVVESFFGSSTAIQFHLASRRAAHVARSIAMQYGDSEWSLDLLKEAAAGARRLPLSAVISISKCFNLSEVFKECKTAADSIEDGFFADLPFAPTLSLDMTNKFLHNLSPSTVGEILNTAVRHGYFLGLSDAAHSIQDDVAVAPYDGHTAKEMVEMLQSIYTDVGEDEREFLTRIINSEYPRLNRMSRMAIEIFFAMLNRWVK
jgi:hypothetical protein